MARHSGGGLMPYRSPAFVANASLSYAIGNAVRRQQDFNNCMAASGAVPTDATQGSPAAPGASGVSAAARFDEAHWGPTVPGRRRPRDGGGQIVLEADRQTVPVVLMTGDPAQMKEAAPQAQAGNTPAFVNRSP